MSSLPIACTLTATDLAAVKERYRAAAGQYHATARVSDDHADISLTGDKTAIHDLLTEMIARESACCPFLTFDIAETAIGFNVRLRVIDAAKLDHGILRDSVNTLFPGARLSSAPSR